METWCCPVKLSMVLTANDNPEPLDDVPPATVAQLVAYDEAKATEDRMHGDTSRAAEFSPELAPELACVDLLYRVWPTARTIALAHSDPPTPETLGDLRLVRELGRGGMGIVYEAEQTSLGRRVAVKVLPFAAVANAKSLLRFRNEVRAAAALDHPHIVKVYAVGEDGGQHYYTMQLIRGRTLADVIEKLRRREVPPVSAGRDARNANSSGASGELVESFGMPEFYRKAARWGLEACAALQHAHDVSVLHRDIKPSNLMLDEADQLYVTDFGLARVGEEAGPTLTGDIVGTLRYIAPEQALGKKVVLDQRADIYALGATLYELLTLEPVFNEIDRAVLLSQIAFHDPTPLRKHDPRIPIDLETIVLKALAKEPAERYQTAASMADDLRAFAEGRPIMARPPSIVDRMRVLARRHAALVQLAALSLLLLSTVLAISIVLVKRAQTRATAALGETSNLLYTADMALAYQAHEQGRPIEARRVLQRYRPKNAEPDRRGIEWYLLDQVLQPVPSNSLLGHDGSVNEIAVFPDRQRLASVGEDSTLRIWDIATRKCLQTIPLGHEGLHSVAVAPNGRYVAAGGTTAYLCDLEDGGRTTVIYHNEQKCTFESLAFSPDGQRIAIGERYDGVSLVSLDGRVLKQIPCRSRVESLEFLPDGSLLVPNRIREGTGILEIWDGELTKIRQSIDCSRSYDPAGITVGRGAMSGRFVLAGELKKSQAHMMDVANGAVLATTSPSHDWLTAVAYAPTGDAVALAYANGQVKYFTVEAIGGDRPTFPEQPVVIDAHEGEVTSVQFLGVRQLVSCGADGKIQVWDLSATMYVGHNIVGGRATGIAVSPNGTRLLCTGYAAYAIVDETTGKSIVLHQEDGVDFSAPAWSPRGDRAALANNRQKQVLVLAPDGELKRSWPAPELVRELAFSSDGTLLAMIGGRNMRLLRVDSGQSVYQQELPNEGMAACFSSAETVLAYGGKFKKIVLLDTATLHVQREISCAIDTNCLAFSPDDRLLATGHSDSAIRLWDVPTGQLRAALVGHERALHCVIFSADGRTLFSSAEDGAVRLWSVEQQRAYGVFYRRTLGLRPESQGKPCWVTLPTDNRYVAVGYHCSNLLAPHEVFLWHVDSIKK